MPSNLRTLSLQLLQLGLSRPLCLLGLKPKVWWLIIAIVECPKRSVGRREQQPMETQLRNHTPARPSVCEDKEKAMPAPHWKSPGKERSPLKRCLA
jgi:hypothetical protein